MDDLNNVVNLGIVKTYDYRKHTIIYNLYVNGTFHDSYDDYEFLINEVRCLTLDLEV